ncbi:MAG: CARDB domain-containing protein, partial [Verrucomicrobiota bacterium]
VYNDNGVNYDGGIYNLPGALFSLQNDQFINGNFGHEFFNNAGTVRKSGATGTTTINVAFNNSGLLDVQSGIISLQGRYSLTNGALNLGISSLTDFGKLVLSGNATLGGSLGANLNNGYLPGAGNSYVVLTYGSESGTFTNLNLPVLSAGQSWQVSYAPSATSLQVINLAGITAQITGSVDDNQGRGVTNITLFAYTTNTPYLYVSVLTDNNGSYSLNLTNGTWVVGVQGLLARGYFNVPNQSVAVTSANQVVNFVVQPFLGQGFTVTTGINPPGTGTATGGGTFPDGSMITVTATPNTNQAPYFFANWTENGLFQSGSSSYTFAVTRDFQLVANFALPLYLISASNNPAGAGTVTGAGSYIYGATNVLRASPNPGYNFAAWTEGPNILSTNPVLSTVVYSNRLIVANYSEANVIHAVTTATSPAALATVAGAGVYTNGQSATLSAPAVVVSGQYDYFFQEFVLTNAVVSTSASFTRVFSTVDPTNLEYVAVYARLGITPVVTNVSVNFPNPVPATTNFQIVFQLDRTMNTNFTPQITLTNSAPGALQPRVPAGGHWASLAQNLDTFYPPPIPFTNGMDGAIRVFISGAQDPLGVTMGLTNVYTILLDATPPVLSNIAAAPSVLTAFVTWNSDEPASSLVEYGTSPAYGLNSALDSQLATAHGVTLDNLSPLTTYHFRVHSRDQAGNETISGDNSFTAFAAPDLQVTNLSVTGGLVSGGNLLISWADTNSGSGATFTYWYDQVIVTNSTTGQTLLNSSLFYDPSVNGNIASGGSQNRQFHCQLPNGPPGAGNLQIIVTVNAYGSQYEANGSGSAQINNTQSIALSSVLGAYPDLQITGLALTNSQLQSGNVVGIVWNDANSGNGSVSNSFYDQIVVVNQATGQTLVGAVLLDNAAGTPIAPGQSVGRQFSFALPDGAPGAGTLQIMITADIFDNVFEYNARGTAKGNNTNSIAVASALAAYPDLTVTNISWPASAAAGQAIEVSWTDTNLGNAAATNTWTDQIFLADDLALSNEQLLGTLTLTRGLGAGQSVTNTETVMLPAFGAGAKWLVVKADADNGIFELNKTNNTGIAAQPLLVAETLTLSVSPASFVQNAPNPAATGTLTRSGDTSTSLTATLASSDMTSATVPLTVTIPAGRSSAAFAVNALPSNLVRGTRVVAITANASGYATATNLLTVTDNNVPTLAVSISRSSVGESFAQPIACTVTRNTSTNIALTVTPVSDLTRLSVPATVTIPAGAWSALFNVSIVSNALPTTTAVVSVSAIAPGYVSVPDAISIIDDDLPGLVLTVADPFITENSRNPASQGALTLKSPSSVPLNIVLQSGSSLVSIPSVVSMPSNQTSVTFPINVINDHLVHGPTNVTLTAFITDGLLGTILPAGGATNTITVIDDNGPALTLALGAGTISETGSTTATAACNLTPTNDLLLSLASSDTTVATVPAGVTILAGQTNASFTVRAVNPGVPTGPRRVTVTASATNFATGVASLNVSDVNLPDLRVAGITLPASALASTIVPVSYTVENDGIWAATNAWTDFVYYSTSPSGANPQYVSQVLQTNALGVGQSYTNTVNLFLPPDPGQYYLLVNANAAKSLTEISYQNNNLISTGYIDVQPPYRGAVVADLAAAPSGTPIPMHGHAFLAQNPNQPAAFVPLTIRVLVKGTRRLFTVTTDPDGNFTYLFQPLSNEAGNYQIAADHPAVATDTIQSGFALYGMSFSDSGLTQSLYPNTVASGQLVLQNLGDLPLSGVAAVAEGATSSLGIQVALSNSIPASGSTLLAYTLTPGNISSAVQIRARIHVTSAEGAVAYYPLTITVAPQTATLVANPGTLVRAMLRGQQTFVDFDLMNVGGAASGPIQLQLPQADWLAATSATNLASLAPGQTNRITLSLTPGPDLALEPYNGTIGVAAANAGLSLPFQFRAISDALGDVQVTVPDDYTYYVAGAPLVTNAVVTLTDPYANAVVASNMTGQAGLVLFTNVDEGTYQLTVTADRHTTFQSPVTVLSGRTNQVTAFIARQTVTYQWTVVPTQIPDNYQVTLESVFETEVPIPVVTIDNPLQIPLIIEGEDTEMDIQVSNHGLIAAQRVQLVVPTDNPDYELVALTTNIDTVPAMSTITIPVIIRARTNSPALLARKGIRPLDSGTTITGCPSLPQMTLKWGFVCGDDFNWHAVNAEVVPVDATSCIDALKKLLGDEIKDLGKAGKNWKDSLKWKDQLCKLTDVLEACGVDHCLVAILQLSCGLVSRSFSGILSGALNMRNCFCPSIPDVSSPDDDSPTPPPIGQGRSGASSGNLGNVTLTADQAGWAYSTCTPGQTLGNPTVQVVRQI